MSKKSEKCEGKRDKEKISYLRENGNTQKFVIPISRWESSVFTVSIKIKTPLVSVRFASTILGISEQGIMRLIQEGKLNWAWDFRRATARRSFIFVLAHSLRQYQDGNERSSGADYCYPEDWNRVIKLILPHDKLVIKGSEIVQRFSISSQHMMNLVNDGSLKVLNARRLRTSTPLISRQSVVEFLKKRLIV